MRTASDVLFSLRERNVKVWVAGEQLRLQAPKEALLLPDELNELRALKVDIIDLLQQIEPASEIPLQPRAAGGAVPLTAVQMRYWQFAMQTGFQSRRLCTVVLHIQGGLDVCLLRQSIEYVVQRHDSLHTRIVTADGIPFQHIDTPGYLHFEQINWSWPSHENLEFAVSALIDTLLEQTVDLAIGPLFNVVLFRLSAHAHVLSLAWNHLVVDGISKGIVTDEIWTVYDQGARGLPFCLPQVSLQFSDYAVWQRKMYPVWKSQHDAYWRTRLATAQETAIPCASGSMETEHSVAFMQFPFGTTLSAELRDLARRERTLLSLVGLAIYAVVMSRWCSRQDLLILLAVNGRDRPEMETMVGFIATAHYLRIELLSEDCLVELLRRISAEFYAAYEHQDIGIDFIPQYSTDLTFNWRPTFRQKDSIEHKLETGEQFRVRRLPYRAAALPRSHKFFTFFCETAAGIDVTAEYWPDVIPSKIVERLGYNLLVVAKAFARHPFARVDSIPISFQDV